MSPTGDAARGVAASSSAPAGIDRRQQVTGRGQLATLFPGRSGAKGKVHAMNIVLWVLQALAALMFGASGVMKVFMFDKISHDVPSFGALPRRVWMALGMVELVCALGLIVPGALRWNPSLTAFSAVILALESIVFVAVHVKYRELTPIILSSVLGLLMAFVAYGRMVLVPIF